MAPQSHELLTRLLKQVSRSFYLTLRILPGAIRPPIGLAYLLARATDTIADTEIVAVDQRLEALRALRDAMVKTDSGIAAARPSRSLGELARHQGLPAERELLERIDQALALLSEMPADDRQRISDVLATITGGQELDLRRFGRASVDHPVSLATGAELDDYTYRVAGCVGEFWTKICQAHLFAGGPVDESFFLTNGVRFGKGLQLVNILRDLPRDLRQGRCYLPADELAGLGLSPRELLETAKESRVRPVYDRYLDVARAHLAAGWDYTNALPRGCTRVRLACAWPILIGVRTLDRLRHGNILDPAQRIKVTRAEVRGILCRSLIWLPFPGRWRRLFREARTS